MMGCGFVVFGIVDLISLFGCVVFIFGVMLGLIGGVDVLY